MAKFIRLFLGLLGLVVIIAFAVSNRTPVGVTLWPLPQSIEIPLYTVFMFGLVIGVLLGGIGSWLANWHKRREGKRMRNRAWALENQLNVMKEQQKEADAKAYDAARAGFNNTGGTSVKRLAG